RVESFVSEFLSLREEEKRSLSEDTKLLQDLGMDGTDAVEFMEAFSEKFDVDMSEFEFKKHFGPEAPATLASLVRYRYCRLFGGDPTGGLIPITLRDLVSAAKVKKWHKLKGKTA
ncbi:MAG TPA: DUF1493 family protein, partial [Thermodesulfobacteriota bacterium]|nr:DUF1493 family protein [Thermodesulfobacteriota bacterium]